MNGRGLSVSMRLLLKLEVFYGKLQFFQRLRLSKRKTVI